MLVIFSALAKVDKNRSGLLSELGSVAVSLGSAALLDLDLLCAQLAAAVKNQEAQAATLLEKGEGDKKVAAQLPASALTLPESSSELRLLRVLQSLVALDGVEGGIMAGLDFGKLWDVLASCLKYVGKLEGLVGEEEEEGGGGEEGAAGDTNGSISMNSSGFASPMGRTSLSRSVGRSGGGGADTSGASAGSGAGGIAETAKMSQSSSMAALLSRFLPSIEAFFIFSTSKVNKEKEQEEKEKAEKEKEKGALDLFKPTPLTRIDSVTGQVKKDLLQEELAGLVGGVGLVQFVRSNRVLLNALLRSKSSLLESSLKALVEVKPCRMFLDFDIKRKYFTALLRKERQRASRRHGSIRLNVRRAHVFEDAFHLLRLRTAEEMRGRFNVQFHGEEGVDAGGVTREFYEVLAKEMFNPNFALFMTTQDGCTFQPNPNSHINQDHLQYFRFVGRIVGKAICDGQLISAHFVRSFYKACVGAPVDHTDMAAVDADYYKNLRSILQYSLDDLCLDLTFSVERDSFGKITVHDLKPNGRTVAVTDETKGEYVSLVCEDKLTTSVKPQLTAFLTGLHELVSEDLLSLFSASELELLISGMPNIDLDDLKANTEYQGGYKASTPVIGYFWNVVSTFTEEDKAKFLMFVTGSTKVPLEGFAALQGMRGVQRFSLNKAFGENSLPCAHTCFNSIDLPEYKDEETLREKLMMAINEGATGFGFA